jgi:hypothetical protein
MLASACGGPWPRSRSGRCADRRRRPAQCRPGPTGTTPRPPRTDPGDLPRPLVSSGGRRRRGLSPRGLRPLGRHGRGRRVQPCGSGRTAGPADRAGRGAARTGRATGTRRGQARYGAPGDDGAGAQRCEHDPDGRSRRPGTGATGAPGARVPASRPGDRRPDHPSDREPCSVRPAGPGEALARRADPLERLGSSVASPLLAGEGLVPRWRRCRPSSRPGRPRPRTARCRRR